MSTPKHSENVTLDAETIKKLIVQMPASAQQLFGDIVAEIRMHGSAMSDATMNELAKKYADKARRLAGAGDEV